MQIALKKGAKMYLNGAVIRADRKVNIELLNDATFLLDTHIMPAEGAKTPIAQLYFVLQSTMMKPANSTALVPVLRVMIEALKLTHESSELRASLDEIETLAVNQRFYDALKRLRPFVARHEESGQTLQENVA